MRAAYENYRDQGFEVLSVSIREGDPEVDEFMDRYGLTYPMLMDRSGQVSNIYQIASTPTTYFIAPDGTIADTLAGVVSQSWLEKNLQNYIST